MSASGAIANVQAAINAWLAVEHRPLLTVDGVYGPKTDDAFELLAQAAKAEHDGGGAAPVSSPAPTDAEPLSTDGLDPRTVANIRTLHPRVQPIAAAFLREIRATDDWRIIDGSRTWEQQDALYEQGRSKPGQIVTNARGGQSNHNYALAFDLGLFAGGSYIDDSPKYRAIASIGERHGLAWGGHWKNPVDEPHYEVRPDWAKDMSEGAMLAGLRQRHEAGKDAFA